MGQPHTSGDLGFAITTISEMILQVGPKRKAQEKVTHRLALEVVEETEDVEAHTEANLSGLNW